MLLFSPIRFYRQLVIFFAIDCGFLIAQIVDPALDAGLLYL
ncbi:hypothetical protein [Bartonella tribocorum]|nr:hypothetical protein [Bartonella tribocorum]